MKKFYIFLFSTFLFSQVQYNHPELDWETIETDHFNIFKETKKFNSMLEDVQKFVETS